MWLILDLCQRYIKSEEQNVVGRAERVSRRALPDKFRREN
jgi:hypothetical protein